ncbi:threonine aldolase [Paraoerskovia sediminicola]|uniref:Threonine aldolase n=1 Tax=Paraoerskovia sediminicola TaxID=1138587 RepID=A0ABN6XBM8_9CELL|nr:beta-eliminating lyase-related protein [Paraoerskovia sediminicola]BDZ42259.1 threonine aldolase [Paraoerskovia sediminicola]
MTAFRSFASDNHAGVHPEVLAAVGAANTDHAVAYGEDPWTARLDDLVREELGDQAVTYPVFNGTGANVVGLSAMLPRWGAVVAGEASHVNADEQGAPERVGGIKVIPVPSVLGKIGPDAVLANAGALGNVHHAQPLAVLITQSTELGTLYTPAEIRAVADAAHDHGMRLFLDGARLANAAAALDVPLRALTTDVGVDALSLGGTKNGAMAAEAVVLLNPDAADGLAYVRKGQMQLASKMRYVSAQLVALLERPGDGGPALWRRSAQYANEMAARLRSALDDDVASGRVRDLAFVAPTEVNALFVALPREAADEIRRSHPFYDFAPGPTPETVVSRWMCAWDTTSDDVARLLETVRRVLG